MSIALKGNRQKNRNNTASTGQNQLRIIGGKWRGRKLEFPLADDLRPTGDRIRETVFNWLAPDIIDAHCLDLFAGSGAMGLEALSRGADSVTFVEKHPVAAKTIQQHCLHLQANNATVLHSDALQWLRTKKPETAFNLVFLDPPFNTNLLQPAINSLEDNDWLANNTIIYIETSRNTLAPEVPPTWQPFRSKTAGQVVYQLFIRN